MSKFSKCYFHLYTHFILPDQFTDSGEGMHVSYKYGIENSPQRLLNHSKHNHQKNMVKLHTFQLIKGHAILVKNLNTDFYLRNGFYL